MRRNSEFLMRQVADTTVVVPVGAATFHFHGMLTLNSTGAFLWEQLETEQTVESLTAALLSEYQVTEETARKDVERFLEKMLPTGAILE